MKKEEVKITSFQAENYRLQLLYITKEMKNGTIKKVYEVRENRKVICSTVIYDNAKEVYARCINDNLDHKDGVYFRYMPDQIQLNIDNNKGRAIYFIDQAEVNKFTNSRYFYQVHENLYNNVIHKLFNK